MINKLIKLADYLDANGAEKEAAQVDELIKVYAKHQSMSKSLSVQDNNGDLDITVSYSSNDEGNYKSETKKFKNIEDAMQAFKNLGDSEDEESDLEDEDLQEEEEDDEDEDEDDSEDALLSHLINQANKEEELNSRASTLETLVKLADYLDSTGDHEKAEELDNIIKVYAVDQSKVVNPYDYSMDYREENPKSEQSKRYDAAYHHSQVVKEPVKKQERMKQQQYNRPSVSTYGVTGHALSTRHCSDHIGVSLKRVGENIWQCPLDGAIYNYEVGFKDQNGNQVPGGSVANQTPMASEYAIPSRLFDSREPVINSVN